MTDPNRDGTTDPAMPDDGPTNEIPPLDLPEPLMQFFTYGHLSQHLQEVSAPFSTLAWHIVTTLPRNPERTVALRKLLESKDCAVRARLFK